MSREKQIDIEVITYEQDRLNYFADLMHKAQKNYDRLYKKYKESPYLFDGTTFLSDAGRELSFCKDVVEMLEEGYRKQEWISVEERLPGVTGKYICCAEDKNGNAWTMPAFWDLEMKLWFGEFGIIKNLVTHWMPLPEPPKMKGGGEE